MQVFNLNCYDVAGGAARAAYRIHHALRSNAINSTLLVNSSTSDDWTVSARKKYSEKLINDLKYAFSASIPKLLKTSNINLHSASVIPSKWPKFINESQADLVNLHWFNHEMLSIKDVKKLKKPLVWTLHDMWGFCGAEHYTEDFRWRDGYKSDNRPEYESGFDLNKWVFDRKLKYLQKPMHIIAPSSWLADCAKKSILMQNWPIHTVPNAIDTNLWKPVEKNLARQLLNLPLEPHLVMFGALDGVNDTRKGFDLLKDALGLLKGEIKNLELVVFGQLEPKTPLDLGFPVHYMGHLHDDTSLIAAYSAVDVMVVPSKQEAFGQTASEALSCGTPVLAFKTTGLLDIVKHQTNGYLAKAFDVEDLANGIKWIFADSIRYQQLSMQARIDAVNKFSYKVVAEQYIQIYNSAINDFNSN